MIHEFLNLMLSHDSGIELNEMGDHLYLYLIKIYQIYFIVMLQYTSLSDKKFEEDEFLRE